MRKRAIQAATYIYFAQAAFFIAVSIATLLIEEPLDARVLLALFLFLGTAAFCGYMGKTSRAFLRMAPVPSRAQIGIWGGASFLVGGLAGTWLVVALLVPWFLLAWAVQPRAA